MGIMYMSLPCFGVKMGNKNHGVSRLMLCPHAFSIFTPFVNAHFIFRNFNIVILSLDG